MGLEIFVLSMCIEGSTIGCEYASSAYYSQSGIQKSVELKQEKYVKSYPALIPFIATASFYYQDRAIINIGNGESIILDKTKNMLSVKMEF